MQPYADQPTFLLPRPSWVNDTDVQYCSLCKTSFGPLRRRHHCRHCGNVFCHECSCRKVPLPQLGYGTPPVRVCKGCFEVAYLVTYAIDDDHGLPTQIHGVRGLLALVEKNNENDLQTVVMHGGVDALIWLCRASTSVQIHHLITTALAILSGKEAVRPVLATKWALPPLLHLIEHYTYCDINNNQVDDKQCGNGNQTQGMVLEIVINCIQVFLCMARAAIITRSVIFEDGFLSMLLTLAAFETIELPVRSAEDTRDDLDEDSEHMYIHRLKERVNIIQALAAKTISVISEQVPLQVRMIEHVCNNDKFASLLRSTNNDVRKFIAKSIAYLSLSNDTRKSTLLSDNVACALVSIIALLPQHKEQHPEQRKYDLHYYLSRSSVDDETLQPFLSPDPSAVSHACCALANFATNQGSQGKLISQPRLLRYVCNVPDAIPNHVEVCGHVTRCLGNLSLYQENHGLMLAFCDDYEHRYNVLLTLVNIGEWDQTTRDIQRHVIRAIDNLTAYAEEEGKPSWSEIFRQTYPFISRIISTTKDQDTLRRAQSIQERATHAGIQL